jgi:hypothetical protein
LPFLLRKRLDLRVPWVVVGIGFHIGIAAMMDVGVFSLVMVAFYPCLFRPEELRAFARRLTLRRG